MKHHKYIRKVALYLRYRYLDAWLRLGIGHRPKRGLHVPQLEGKLPERSGVPLLVFAAADSVYFSKYGKSFIGSLLENGKNMSVHIHLYNPTAEQINFLRKLASRLKQISLGFTWENVNLDHLDCERRGRYYYSVRFIRMAQIFENAKANCLCLDIDALLVRPVGELLAEVGDADIGFYARLDKFGADTKLLAGTLHVRYRPLVQALLSDVGERIEQFVMHGYLLEKLDQLVIYDKFRKTQKSGQSWCFQAFDGRIVDLRFSDRGVIWYPKGNSKNEHLYQIKLEEFKETIDRILENRSYKPQISRGA